MSAQERRPKWCYAIHQGRWAHDTRGKVGDRRIGHASSMVEALETVRLESHEHVLYCCVTWVPERYKAFVIECLPSRASSFISYFLWHRISHTPSSPRMWAAQHAAFVIRPCTWERISAKAFLKSLATCGSCCSSSSCKSSRASAAISNIGIQRIACSGDAV